MSDESLIISDPREISTHVDHFSEKLCGYLICIGLPTDGVLVEIRERGTVLQNMPLITEVLTEEQRDRAHYISKFIASCSVGLFDAALNYLWNETIVNLRNKVARFDLEYFYDSALGDSKKRSEFKIEDDLIKLEDWELIRGCHETGIITDIGFKHLNYIRDMRNFASAAHPNHTQLTGFQLLGWLDTCIREVLAKEPAGPVLTIRTLLGNIRNEVFTQRDSAPIIASIRTLPQDLVNSLLKALFGMYTDERLDANVRNNINLIAETAWDQSSEATKYEIALKHAYFAANADLGKRDLAKQFLTIVDGMGYLTEDQLAIDIKENVDALMAAHVAFNNFYHEEPHAKTLSKTIPKTGIIPASVRTSYVKVIAICKMGNNFGVSYAAEPYYDEMIGKFQIAEIISFLKLLNDKEVIALIDSEVKANRIKEILKMVKDKISDYKIKKALTTILDSSTIDMQSTKTYQSIKELLPFN